jgi:dihydroxy-acid dehydratase
MLYPMQSALYPNGLSDTDIDKPLVGVVSAWNEAAPCNIALQRQAQPAKKGVKDAGGTPREFCTITVTDGMAMGHQGMKSSLVSREVIADSIELTVRGHCYDALVGIAGCDKSVPGMMLAMVRLNIPSVFMYGGSILPGRFKGEDVTIIDVFEGIGKCDAGQMSREDLKELTRSACPSAGGRKPWVTSKSAPSPGGATQTRQAHEGNNPQSGAHQGCRMQPSCFHNVTH